MHMMKKVSVALLASTLLFGTANAATINFGSFTAGTVLTNQVAGLTFSMSGGPTTATAPIVGYGYFDAVLSLNNSGNFGSGTDGYPTGAAVTIDFASSVSGVSFTFNNYGNNTGNDSIYQAFDAANALISSGSLANVNGFSLVNVAGSGIKSLVISNGSGGGYNWVYGVGELSYNGGVPEPAAWAMMLAGFGLVGAAMRRRQTAQVTYA